MRQVQFPDIYTEWPVLKDIRESDCDNIKNYQSAINNNDMVSAYDYLSTMKNKFMQTKDWQERFDVCDEMVNYLQQYQTISPYSNYHVGKNEPNLKDGDMWFDTSTGIIACTYLGLSTQYVEYKLHSGAPRTIYVDIIKQPINTTSTISVSSSSGTAIIENNRVKITIGYSTGKNTHTIKATNAEGTVEKSVTLVVKTIAADPSVLKVDIESFSITKEEGFRLQKKVGSNWIDLLDMDTISSYADFEDNYIFTLDKYDQDFRILTKSSFTKVYSNNKLQTLTEVTIGTTTYKCYDPLGSNSGATINVKWFPYDNDDKINSNRKYLQISCNIEPYIS